MRLRDLETVFVVRLDDRRMQTEGVVFTRAHGVMFLCPKCFAEKRGVVGIHSVICWFRGKVPDSTPPGPGRWDPSGTGVDDLTLSPSVHLSGPGCGWHGWVKNGGAT